MQDQEIAQLIFPDDKKLEQFLKDEGSYDIYEDLLKFGLKTKQFLYVDYKGECCRKNCCSMIESLSKKGVSSITDSAIAIY